MTLHKSPMRSNYVFSRGFRATSAICPAARYAARAWTPKSAARWHRAGYTFNTLKFLDDTEISSTNFGRTVTPKHILRLWSDYRLPGAWSAWTFGGGVNYQTGSYTETRSVRVSQAPYAVWNARIGYKINKNRSAALNVNNLFDKTYHQTIGAPGWAASMANLTTQR